MAITPTSHSTNDSVSAVLRKNWLPLAVLAIVFVLVFGYSFGFRTGPGLTFVRTGTLTLTGIPRGAVVYADLTRRGTAGGADMSLKLVPGTHNIIVDIPGSYPWNDVVTVSAGKEVKDAVVNVPKELNLQPLPVSDFTAITALLQTYKLPDATAPLKLANGCALVTVSGKQVLAQGTTTPDCQPPAYLCPEGVCTSQSIVFSAHDAIRAIMAVPGRQDALMLSYGTTVAVIELNPVSPQFFAPIFEGKEAAILPWKGTSFVLVHDSKAYQTALP